MWYSSFVVTKDGNLLVERYQITSPQTSLSSVTFQVPFWPTSNNYEKNSDINQPNFPWLKAICKAKIPMDTNISYMAQCSYRQVWYWQLIDIPRWTGPLTFGLQHSVRSRMMPSLPLWGSISIVSGFLHSIHEIKTTE